MKRIFTILLACLVLMLGCPTAAMAEEPAVSTGEETIEKTETQITGLLTVRTKKPSAKIQDTIRVTPGGERKVKLQMYNTSTKKWKTKKTYVTAENGKVTLEYPDSWKKKTISRWRVVVSATKTAEAYTSETIQIITRNRKELKLQSKSAIIMELDSGQVFYGKSMDTERANASTTKIMTAILALEDKKLNSTVKLTKQAVNTPYSNLGKQALNDTVSMKHLLYMALLPSDNGAAEALAIHTAGSEKAFVKLMNKKAEELGCTHTKFKNPHGLDEKNHYSSARDLAEIARYAMQNETFRKIVSTKSYTFKTAKKKRKYTVNTTDQLLGSVKGVCGMKTGTTGNAGCCFVGAYKYKGKTYITVVLGASKNTQRWDDTKQLINYIQTYM